MTHGTAKTMKGNGGKKTAKSQAAKARGDVTITGAMRGEHGVLKAFIDHVSGVLATNPDLSGMRAMANALDACLVSHADVEDALLIVPLAGKSIDGSLMEPFRQEHRRIQAGIAAAATATDAEVARSELKSVLSLAIDHFEREEAMLFPMVETAVGPRTLRELGAEWAARRGVRLGATNPLSSRAL